MSTMTVETAACSVRPEQSPGIGAAHGTSRNAFYLQSGGQSIFAWLHTSTIANTDHGVVICPPIGFEQLHAHRSLRHLAEQLSAHRLPTLRFDWHGTGDSSGADTDADRLNTWLENVRSAVAWMKDELGCSKVSVVGLRFGATLAALALNDVEIENLVLWAPVTNGRGSVREMHVIDMMSETHTKGTEPAGTIEAAGFRLTSETAASLSKSSLLQSQPAYQRLLIANRDDAPVDQRVIDHFTKQGRIVDQQTVPGVAQMLVEPHKAQLPEVAIQQIVDWVHQAASNSESATIPSLHVELPAATAVTQPDGNVIRETAWQLSESPHLFGILCEPTAPPASNRPTIILLNAGSAYRIGPGRMNVEMAREFAEHGFRCLRLDLCGLGDSLLTDPSLENDSYAATAFGDIRIAMQALRQRFGPQKFVLMGLCSGAYASFQAAAQFEDRDLVESVLINPLTYYWEDGMTLETATSLELIREHYYLTSALQPGKWWKLLTGRSSIGLRGAIRMVAHRLGLVGKRHSNEICRATKKSGPSHPVKQDLAGDLRSVVAAKRELSLFFSTTDPGYSIMMTQARRQAKRMLRRGQMTATFIDDADHTFSRQFARQKLIRSLCEHLDRRYSASGPSRDH